MGPERVAAFFCEPVIGAGGVHPPPDGYIEGVADLCAEHGVLLVIDSVICGFGRLGTWFGIERWEDVRPDLITFAKGVTAGYLPLGGVVVSGEVAGPFFDEPGGPMLRHGATYAGHPACCAAAMAVLDIYEREDIIPRGRELEQALADALAPLAEHPAVASVRAGTGLLAAVQLAPEAIERDSAAIAKVAAGAREAGVLLRPLLGALAVSPPLIVRAGASRRARGRVPRGSRPPRRRWLSPPGIRTSSPSCARARPGSPRRWSRRSRRWVATCWSRRPRAWRPWPPRSARPSMRATRCRWSGAGRPSTGRWRSRRWWTRRWAARAGRRRSSRASRSTRPSGRSAAASAWPSRMTAARGRRRWRSRRQRAGGATTALVTARPGGSASGPASQ